MVISAMIGCSKVKNVLVSISNTVLIFNLTITSTSFKYYVLDTLRETFSKVEHLFNNINCLPYPKNRKNSMNKERRKRLAYLEAQSNVE